MVNEEKNNEIEEKVEVEDSPKPEISDHHFGWESLASVEESRQNQLISEVYSLMSTGDDLKLDFIKDEWNSLSAEGIDPKLEERFNHAIKLYETRQERIDEAQKIKKELIQEAEKVKDSKEWNKTATYLQELQGRWKEAGFAGQDIDQELWEKFRAINDVFFDSRSKHFENLAEAREETREVKEKLIEEAEALKDSTDWKKTSVEMRDLMTRWKDAGFAGRDYEDALWERFNESRQHFYENQRNFFEELRATHDEAKNKKAEIVASAEKVVESFNPQTVREEMDKLFEEWKTIGHSGREHEEKLWSQFKSLQDEFYFKIKNRDLKTAEERREELENEVELLEVRMSALENLNEKVKIKLTSLERQFEESDSEELAAEIAELKASYEENEKKLDEYADDLDRYSKELFHVS